MGGRRNRKIRREALRQEFKINLDFSNLFKKEKERGYSLIYFNKDKISIIPCPPDEIFIDKSYIVDKCIDEIGERVKTLMKRYREGMQDFPTTRN
jgi:hypothetical protein